MKPNCSETLGFELRTLAEKRDAEVAKFGAQTLTRTDGLLTNTGESLNINPGPFSLQ